MFILRTVTLVFGGIQLREVILWKEQVHNNGGGSGDDWKQEELWLEMSLCIIIVRWRQ